MAIQYVQGHGTKHRVGSRSYELLWGDPCHVTRPGRHETAVWARGRHGTVPTASLGPDPRLLEMYVIDVGQGDSVLVKTPDRRWHLIDGGIDAESQMTKKSSANFLRWKFLKELRRRRVTLESVILSHPDFDHYGGLIDVLSGTLPPGGGYRRNTFPVTINNFYHPGMGRFRGDHPLGRTARGQVEPFPVGGGRISRSGTFITELLSGKTSFRRPSRPFSEGRAEQNGFADLARLVGAVPGTVRALSTEDRFLPGYEAGSRCEVRVLGPVVERFGDRRGLRQLGGESKTRNGHSIVLRFDYGRARILLTGDLNTKSQRLLLSYVEESEFASDVAKGCHHGSDDIDLRFVRAMAARATVISSGDNEDYAHPRPRVLGASARYGRDAVAPNGEELPPLLYSTELARSVALAYSRQARVDEAATYRPEQVDVRETTRADWRDLERTSIATDLVYGLINVRTDGRTILMASLEERGTAFDRRVFRAGASPG